MGKMSQRHADTAPERADAAELDAAYYRDECERLRAENVELSQAARDLSTWAACIHWSEHAANTTDWLDVLRERIEAVQALTKPTPEPPSP